MFPERAALRLPRIHLQRQVGRDRVFHEVPVFFLARMNMAGLRPDHDMLDIGCGCGRVARCLCDYLEPSSQCEGFDIMANAIAWCRENITPAHPNFGFTPTPLHNTAYRSDPSLPEADTFRFPYDDGSFDFVAAQSVFSHLTPDSAANYIRETAGVLRPGGIACTTWFWFGDDYTKEFVLGDKTALRYPANPEAAIAYRSDLVTKMFGDAGMTVEPLPGFMFQDLAVAVRH
jgi:ubiquinone/menaquinone biosynthesis C-methylase UbiE